MKEEKHSWDAPIARRRVSEGLLKSKEAPELSRLENIINNISRHNVIKVVYDVLQSDKNSKDSKVMILNQILYTNNSISFNDILVHYYQIWFKSD